MSIKLSTGKLVSCIINYHYIQNQESGMQTIEVVPKCCFYDTRLLISHAMRFIRPHLIWQVLSILSAWVINGFIFTILFEPSGASLTNVPQNCEWRGKSFRRRSLLCSSSSSIIERRVPDNRRDLVSFCIKISPKMLNSLIELLLKYDWIPL